MTEFKYYIELPWIPLKSCDLRSSRTKINVSKIRRPEIVKSCGAHIYEVSDPFLFYTDDEGVYEYIVYEFQLIRVVKFRKINSSESFKMCIKSKTSDLKFLNLIQTKDKPSLSKIIKYNSNIYYEIENPYFIDYAYEHVADLIGYENGGMYLSLGNTNYFLQIGKSAMNFRAKVQANFIELIDDVAIQLMIFDVYQWNGIILRDNWETRAKFITKIVDEINKQTTIKLKAKPFELLDAQSDHCIIIDNDKIQYMEYNINMPIFCQANTQVYQLKFKDGFVNVDEKTFGQPPICQNGEIIACSAENSPNIINPHACDVINLDKFSTFKFFSRKEVENDRNKFNKKTVIKSYAAGKTLVLTNTPFNIYEIEYDEFIDMSEVDVQKYHTIVIDDDTKFLPDIEKFGKKIVLFNGNTWEFKDAGEKTFIFLVGTIGSGKSVLIKKVRTLFNMSGGIFIAQIDKLIESDIEFIVNHDGENYWKLRNDIYNKLLDQLIGQSIVQSNSIILETTHVNNDFVNWLKQYGYKIVVVIVQESYEQTCENISIRNQTKSRKTVLSLEDYQKFEQSIPEFIKNADYVHYLKPEYNS